MRVAVYEFLTGGGWSFACGDAPPKSLRAEGEAMLRHLASDLAEVPDVQVVVPLDCVLNRPLPPAIEIRPVEPGEDDCRALAQVASTCDWTVVIAPEFEQYLESRCRTVIESGGRLLGPSLELVQLAGDKQRTADHLAASGLPVPQGMTLGAGEPIPSGFPRPAVVKPRFGAGSHEVLLVRSPRDVATDAGERRLERYCPGLAASVAVLCGPAGCFPLPPCQQLLSGDGRFAYLGGRLPLPASQTRRATELARRAVESLPAPCGYLGVDLVLGDDPTGRDDVVIEINPRLTTSYVGLRMLAEENLADALLAVAAGKSPRLRFRNESLVFRPDGS